MIWALAALVALAAVPVVREALRSPPAPGPHTTADLPQGATHFRWTGPPEGPVVVCIHGLTTPGPVWDGLAQGLAGRGCRVLRYDLFGRGHSAAPRGVQDAAFFARQLDDLLAREGVGGPFTLMGHSLGGAIAATYAVRRPAQVSRLVLLTPAGSMAPLRGLARVMRDTPLLGDWLFHMLYPARLRQGIAAEQHLPGTVPGLYALQRAQLRRRGFLPAVLSSIRGLSRPLRQTHETLRANATPVLAVWGAEDAVIPLSAADRMARWNPDTVQRIIPGAGHGLPYTHTDAVLALLDAEPVTPSPAPPAAVP